MAWREYNETQEDLANETAVADILKKAWNCEIVKLGSMLYNVDWAFFKDSELVGFGEYKKRSAKKDPLILSYAKYLRGTHLAHSSGKSFILVIEWPDGIWYCNIKKGDEFPVKLTGSSRGQNGDMEPCVLIPLDRFKKVKHEDR